MADIRRLAKFSVEQDGRDFVFHIEDDTGRVLELSASRDHVDVIADILDEMLAEDDTADEVTDEEDLDEEIDDEEDLDDDDEEVDDDEDEEDFDEDDEDEAEPVKPAPKDQKVKPK